MYLKPSNEQPYSSLFVSKAKTLKDFENIEDAYFSVGRYNNRMRLHMYSLKRESRNVS